MNILKSMAVKDVEEATRAIPVIDFGPAFRDEPGGLDAVARPVRGASQEVGFFYLVGHRVPPALVDAAFAASREFHAMPLAEEDAAHTQREQHRFANEAHVNLRFLHYPPQEVDDEQFGQGPHTDNSFITILARTEVPGLAVRLPAGEWLAPPVIDGTFLGGTRAPCSGPCRGSARSDRAD